MKPTFVLFTILLSGCTMSLSASRPPKGVQALDPTCEAIDREHSIATLGAGVLGGLAGAGGLGSIPVKDPDVRDSLLVGGAVSGIGAAGMGLWAQERAERFERRCSQ